MQQHEGQSIRIPPCQVKFASPIILSLRWEGLRRLIVSFQITLITLIMNFKEEAEEEEVKGAPIVKVSIEIQSPSSHQFLTHTIVSRFHFVHFGQRKSCVFVCVYMISIGIKKFFWVLILTGSLNLHWISFEQVYFSIISFLSPRPIYDSSYLWIFTTKVKELIKGGLTEREIDGLYLKSDRKEHEREIVFSGIC